MSFYFQTTLSLVLVVASTSCGETSNSSSIDAGIIDAENLPTLSLNIWTDTADVYPGDSVGIMAEFTGLQGQTPELAWTVWSNTVTELNCTEYFALAKEELGVSIALPKRFDDVRCADELTVIAEAAVGTMTATASVSISLDLPPGLGQEWQERSLPGNPVVGLGTCPTWECLNHSDPTLAYIEDKLTLWFSAGGDTGEFPVVGRAELVGNSFAFTPNAPMLEPAQDSNPNDLPWDYIRETVSMIHTPGLDHLTMVYLGYMTDYFTDPAIGVVHSVSAAGQSFPRATIAVYTPTRPDGWDAAFMTSPAGVLGSDGRWRIYFAGSSLTVPGGNIGVLTSDDGTTWLPASDNPIFRNRQGLGKWDESIIDCHVVFVGGRYLMWYSAFGEGELQDDTTISIGLAQSEDGYSWERVGNAPVLTPAAASWYDTRVLDGEVIVEEDGSLLMAAYGKSNVPVLPGFFPSRLGLWTSSPTN